MSAFTVNTTIEGNLTDEVTLRETSDGTPVANFRVAVTNRSRMNNGEFSETTQFLSVVAWRGLATNAAATLHKGTRVMVTGDLKNRQYDDSEGNTRYVSELHADSLGVSLRYHVVAGIEKASEVLVNA